MVTRESPGENSQPSNYLILNLSELPYVSWDRSPLNFLTPRQKLDVQQQAEARQYSIGTHIWSTEEHRGQFLILSGEVRLREKGKQRSSPLLKQGEWFGDLLELSGQFEAVASSQSTIVIYWDANPWTWVSSADLKQFWAECQRRYQPQERRGPYPVSKPDYPFVPSQKTRQPLV